MQRVKLFKSVYTAVADDWEDVLVEEFVGTVRSDVSPMGVIAVQDYLGVQVVVSLSDYSRLETSPMTEEEILAAPGLGEWYQDQIDKAEQQATANVPEDVPH